MCVALQRQIDPHWRAYFFLTDDIPFGDRLIEILASYNDYRLSFFDVPSQYRPKFDKVDAGYTATDYVVSAMLSREQCQWITVTNADNTYGSEIVHNVRQKNPTDVDMLLAPVDSRNFLNSGIVLNRA